MLQPSGAWRSLGIRLSRGQISEHGEYPEHVEERLAGGSAVIDRLLGRPQGDVLGLELADDVREVSAERDTRCSTRREIICSGRGKRPIFPITPSICGMHVHGGWLAFAVDIVEFPLAVFGVEFGIIPDVAIRAEPIGLLQGPPCGQRHARGCRQAAAVSTGARHCITQIIRMTSGTGKRIFFRSYLYGSTDQNTDSEIDVEQPVTLNGGQGVYDVSLNDHPTKGTIVIANPDFTTQWMTYHSSTDFSAAPHYYTICYNDNANTITKWIDGRLIYTATKWKWSGPNPNTIITLAVGGDWPGTLSNPSTYVGNLDVYSIEYYAPRRKSPATSLYHQSGRAGPSGSR
jgi:hypothetical protein